MKKAIMLTVLGAFGLVFGAALFGSKNDKSTPAFVPIGRQATVQTGFIACRKTEDLERIKTLLSQNDQQAAAVFAASRDCKPLQAGQTGLVEDVSLWTANTCIREQGVPYCYWFPTDFIRAAVKNR